MKIQGFRTIARIEWGDLSLLLYEGSAFLFICLVTLHCKTICQSLWCGCSIRGNQITLKSCHDSIALKRSDNVSSPLFLRLKGKVGVRNHCAICMSLRVCLVLYHFKFWSDNPYPTAFPYGNGMVLHFYQQQESSTTKTVHKVINKRLKTYV